jgi:hypothetical protein
VEEAVDEIVDLGAEVGDVVAVFPGSQFHGWPSFVEATEL